MLLDTGKIINNRYRIVSLLGQGGFGAVYRAWDLNLKHPCALKENLETNLQGQKQFENEATVLANLSHPHLPRVTDHFHVPGQGQYLVMDFVEGQDLDEKVTQDGPVPVQQAVIWISQIADALHYLHTQPKPVIHRDIKPANIRVTSDGTAFLVDFGLVKLYQTQVYTTPGARGVTPGFSPPEQYGQGGTDARTDIYGLAATLYTLVTGKVPPESVHRYSQEKLSYAHLVNPRVPPPLGMVLDRALSLDPDHRYQSAKEFKAAMNAALSVPVGSGTVVAPRGSGTVVVPSGSGTVIAPPMTPVSRPASKPARSGLKVGAVIGIVGAIVLICGLGGAYAFYQYLSPTQTPTLVAYEPTATIPLPGDTPFAPTLTGLPSTEVPATEPPPPPVVVTDLPTLTPTPVPLPPTETWTPEPVAAYYDLAFASDRDGDFQVYVMDTQNQDTKAIPRPSGYEQVWWPTFCGNRVAVEAQDKNGSENKKQWIFLMDIESGDKERLNAPNSPTNLGVPRCSPNGSYLAYSANVGEVWGLFVTDFANTYEIYPSDAFVSGYASWPAYGDNFIFQVVTKVDYKYLIYQMNGHPSGGQYSQISSGANPAMSPDGTWMTYSCESNGDDRTLCMAATDGTDIYSFVTIKRVKVGGENLQPASAWSWDGQWIYFASAADGDWDIYRIHQDGSGLQNLTDSWGPSNEVNPALRW
jgi:serine/threonine protein kinase/Tol biopolymer transport system component